MLSRRPPGSHLGRRAGALSVLGLLLLGGCTSRPAAQSVVPRGPSAPGRPARPAPGPPRYPAYAAVVESSSIVIYSAPSLTSAPVMTLGRLNPNGAPQTFLIERSAPAVSGNAAWYQVLLPVRPNGTTGWIRSTAVGVVGLPYRLVVHLASFRLDLYRGPDLVRVIDIGEGTDQTPTPGGSYYITELLRPPDQDTIYGHYVFGLSGFSTVLIHWPQGGVIGIHGTNDPIHTIGRRISHGCIRMANADIEGLARLLPLGTPVLILAN